MLRFIFALAIASTASAQASEYKKMQCTLSENANWNHIVEYEDGLLYDEIKQNYYNEGILHKRNCSTDRLTVYEAIEFKGIAYQEAHKTKCSMQDGIYFSSSTRKSARGHTLITEVKINFLIKHSSVSRWVCQPGQDKDCPSELWFNFSCGFVD